MIRSFRLLAASTLLVLLLSSVACAPEASETPAPPDSGPPPASDGTTDSPEEPGEVREPSAIAWLDTELVDVETGEAFRVSDFKGRPVLVKTFAVW